MSLFDVFNRFETDLSTTFGMRGDFHRPRFNTLSWSTHWDRGYLMPLDQAGPRHLVDIETHFDAERGIYAVGNLARHGWLIAIGEDLKPLVIGRPPEEGQHLLSLAAA